MDVHVEDLRGLLHSLGPGPVHLVGHSYGAFLSLLVAIREPGLVRTLVLAEPPVVSLLVSDPPRPSQILKLLLTRPRLFAAVLRFGLKGVEPARKAFRAGDDWTGVRIFGRAVFGPSGYDGLPEAQKQQVRDNLSNMRAEILGPGFSPLRPEDVRSVHVPTLLLGGARSVGLFGLLLGRLEELLPSVQRVTIPGAAHAMQEDNPEAFHAAVLSFLTAHRAATRP
jgi:pimeloyl-ACP methyl ester carboxylesterase